MTWTFLNSSIALDTDQSADKTDLRERVNVNYFKIFRLAIKSEGRKQLVYSTVNITSIVVVQAQVTYLIVTILQKVIYKSTQMEDVASRNLKIGGYSLRL